MIESLVCKKKCFYLLPRLSIGMYMLAAYDKLPLFLRDFREKNHPVYDSPAKLAGL